MAQPIRNALLGAWIFAFVAMLGAESVLTHPTLRIGVQLAFGVPLLAWSLWHLRSAPTPDRLDWAIVLAVAATAVVALVGRDALGGAETIGLVACWALLFWAMRSVGDDPGRRRWVASMVTVSLTASLAFNAWLLIAEKLAWLDRFGELPPLEGRTVVPWETVNVMPVVVLLGIPFLAAMQATRTRTWLALAFVPSAALVIAFSGSGTGIIALAVGAIAWLALMPRSRAMVIRRWPLSGRATVVAAVVLAVVAALTGGRVVVRSLDQSGRLLLWEQAVAMVSDRPLTGQGPGAYSWARLLYGDESARIIAVRLTHNVPLQTLIDGGLVLGAAAATVIVAWAVIAGRRMAALTASGRAALAALCGYASTLLLDDYSSIPAVTALVVTLAAWVVGTSTVRSAPRPVPGWAPAGLVLALAAAAVPAVATTDVARVAAADGREAAIAGDWDRAADRFRAATGLHGGIGGGWLALGVAEAQLGARAAASLAYERAIQTSPGDPRGYGGLAALTDDPAVRRSLLVKADDRALVDPQFSLRLGALLAELEPEAAADASARAVRRDSRLFGPLVRTLDRAGAQDLARRVGMQIVAHPRADATLDQAVRFDLALALGSLPADAPTPWLAVRAAAVGDLESARALANAALERSPADARSHLAAAFVALAECDAARAASEEAVAASLGGRPARDDVAIRRELIYREDGLGPAQPPASRLQPLEAWPRSLVDLPACGAASGP